MERHLVVGYGEVGRAIYALLDEHYTVDALDVQRATVPEARSRDYHAVHICVPFRNFERFEMIVALGVEWLRPLDQRSYVLIHSTVPLGTTTRLSRSLNWPRMVHTPVRGTHPDMREGIRTFVKYFGGPDATTVAPIFTPICQVRCFAQAETTEAIKLWDTTQYGWQIVLAKEIAAYCAAHGLDVNAVYRMANQDYNRGYAELGNPRVQRPHLHQMPGPIGGHCVVPNLDLLGENLITRVILSANNDYAAELLADMADKNQEAENVAS